MEQTLDQIFQRVYDQLDLLSRGYKELTARLVKIEKDMNAKKTADYWDKL